jgi:hypothetical protein
VSDIVIAQSVPAAPFYPTPPVPYWLAPKMRDPEFQVKFLNRDNSEHWVSNKGPQTWTLLCPYDETLIGGRRGGSKSAALIAWFAMGDLSLPEYDPARYSYLNEPSFRGLILRKEYQSMAEFVDECKDFFRPFGVKAKDDPVVFEFKSGAKIYTNHLGDKEAYEKYRGHGLTKIGIEELTQIPEERWYLKLFGSLRNKKQVRTLKTQDKSGKPITLSLPALRAQILSTTNPDGVGKQWVKKRFVKVYGGNGKLIPWNTPMRDQISGLTRIFIPMRREDNPYLRDNRQYEGMLLSQDEVTRKQWMDGDWDAGSGTFFSEFRPDGPISDTEKAKYPQACHVIEQVELKPWWYRWGGGDWGFSHLSVFHKACRNERDKRIHIYDELVLRQMGSFEMGVMVAEWWLPDLEYLPDKQITIALSPDAFNKTDATNTKAEQIANGIKEILGPYGAFLLKFNDDERKAMSNDPKLAHMMFERRKQDMSRGQMMIALKPAITDRIAGWSYIVNLLRFRPVVTETEEELRSRLEQVFRKSGVESYERELAKSRTGGPEILPKMLIWKCCGEAIRGLTEAQTDDPPRQEDVRKWDAIDGVGGDDGLDSVRHTAMAYKEVESVIPRSYFIGERMSLAQEAHVEAYGEELTDPTRLAMIARTQAAKYDKLHGQGSKSFSLPRAGSSRHRVN